MNTPVLKETQEWHSKIDHISKPEQTPYGEKTHIRSDKKQSICERFISRLSALTQADDLKEQEERCQSEKSNFFIFWLCGQSSLSGGSCTPDDAHAIAHTCSKTDISWSGVDEPLIPTMTSTRCGGRRVL
jgi:hypothetical protein